MMILRYSIALILAMMTSSPLCLGQADRGKSSSLPGALQLDRMPHHALEIAEAMKVAKIGEVIVLRGRLVMAKDVFDSKQAIFTLIDDAVAASCCPPGGKLIDTCPIPPDYRATIRAVDEKGAVLTQSLEGKGGLKHGAEVFVVGRVNAADGHHTLVINATRIHVPRDSVPTGFFLREMPADVADLSQARASGAIKAGDTVTVRGLVGGSAEPIVGGRTIFTMVGSALKPCNAKPDDHCEVPWDYCCDPKSEITANSATVRIADDRKAALRADLKGRFGFKELSDVVVVGTVASIENGVMLIDAKGLHVVKP